MENYPTNHPQLAREIVWENYSGDPGIYLDEVFIVWFCYILGGWKALVSTTVEDGKYYEVTYNANLDETYLDTYVKFKNQVV